MILTNLAGRFQLGITSRSCGDGHVLEAKPLQPLAGVSLWHHVGDLLGVGYNVDPLRGQLVGVLVSHIAHSRGRRFAQRQFRNNRLHKMRNYLCVSNLYLKTNLFVG